MSAVETIEVFTRQDLDEFAGTFELVPRIAGETWDTLIYLVEVERDVGGPLRCLYRERLPSELALRRLRMTFAIGLAHGAGATRCPHVREVIIGAGASTEAEAERQALLVAAAQVELECRTTCGAMVRDLVPYATARLVNSVYPLTSHHQG